MSHQLTDAQWKRVSEDYAKMYIALSRISRYMSVESLKRNANREYGLAPSEAIEMAYENVIGEAKGGLRSVRKSFPATS